MFQSRLRGPTRQKFLVHSVRMDDVRFNCCLILKVRNPVSALHEATDTALDSRSHCAKWESVELGWQRAFQIAVEFLKGLKICGRSIALNATARPAALPSSHIQSAVFLHALYVSREKLKISNSMATRLFGVCLTCVSCFCVCMWETMIHLSWTVETRRSLCNPASHCSSDVVMYLFKECKSLAWLWTSIWLQVWWKRNCLGK